MRPVPANSFTSVDRFVPLTYRQFTATWIHLLLNAHPSGTTTLHLPTLIQQFSLSLHLPVIHDFFDYFISSWFNSDWFTMKKNFIQKNLISFKNISNGLFETFNSSEKKFWQNRTSVPMIGIWQLWPLRIYLLITHFELIQLQWFEWNCSKRKRHHLW